MEKISVEEAINKWDIEYFICTICLWCEYVVKNEKDFREHLLKEHKQEIKEFWELK